MRSTRRKVKCLLFCLCVGERASAAGAQYGLTSLPHLEMTHEEETRGVVVEKGGPCSVHISTPHHTPGHGEGGPRQASDLTDGGPGLGLGFDGWRGGPREAPNFDVDYLTAVK